MTDRNHKDFVNWVLYWTSYSHTLLVVEAKRYALRVIAGRLAVEGTRVDWIND